MRQLGRTTALVALLALTPSAWGGSKSFCLPEVEDEVVVGVRDALKGKLDSGKLPEAEVGVWRDAHAALSATAVKWCDPKAGTCTFTTAKGHAVCVIDHTADYELVAHPKGQTLVINLSLGWHP